VDDSFASPTRRLLCGGCAKDMGPYTGGCAICAECVAETKAPGFWEAVAATSAAVFERHRHSLREIGSLIGDGDALASSTLDTDAEHRMNQPPPPGDGE